METLPEVPAPRPDPSPPPQRRFQPSRAVQPARVLLACGEPVLCETLQRVLLGHDRAVSAGGVDLQRVHDGRACLRALRDRRPDLLVLHASLDGTSSSEVLEIWRAEHPDDRLPVLVLSSLWLADLTPELRREEAIALPCDNLELVERAARLLLGLG